MTASPSLTVLLSQYRSVSIIGMAKNVGKTTVLNRLISDFNKEKICLGLTSIGRDGESVDVVTATEKPRIFVRSGTIIATATNLLHFCDITKEILAVTDINTPMGRISIVRALSDGYVQLGGPSITNQVADILDEMHKFGTDKIIVDGAVDRRTLASPVVTEATVLCTGASFSNDLETVVSETAHIARMLTLPKIEDRKVLDEFMRMPPNEKMTRIDDYAICLKGAVSDGFIENLIVSNVRLEGAIIVAQDPSKIFIKPATYEKLLFRKIVLMVVEPINLVAIAVNPISVRGGVFDKHEFLTRMSKAVAVPVVDAKSCFEGAPNA